MAEQFDLLIRNGWVVDGSGAPRFRADVGVNGERIVKVGDLSQATGKTEIDADNKVIAPGFIDAHTHDDRLMLSGGWMVMVNGFDSKILPATSKP